MKVTHRGAQAVAACLAAVLAASAQAALTPVFEYSFPASYDGTNTTLTDLSSAGNHGYMQSTGAFLPDERPPSFVSGGSIHGLVGGRAMTNAVDLFDNVAVAAKGGYVMDTWVKWDQEDFASDGSLVNSQFMSYAGTETLTNVNGRIATSIYTDDGADNFVLNFLFGPTVVAGQWYHVVAAFDSTGNVPDSHGSLQGTLTLYVDGVVQDTISGPLHTIGDDIDRSIGLNAWPGDPTFASLSFASTAKLYNPRAYLGTVPEPTAAVQLLAGLLGFGACGARRRAARQS